MDLDAPVGFEDYTELQLALDRVQANILLGVSMIVWRHQRVVNLRLS